MNGGGLATGEIRLRLAGRFGGFALDAEAVFPGQGVTALVGPSGAGKTTLLRCLAGLTRAEGRVQVGEAVWQDGRCFLPTHRRGVGYVFQDGSLLPHLTVAGNLLYAEKRAAGRPGPDFDAVVDLLGLGELLPRAPAVLSGGERQRAAIARALLGRPRLLLMDEPLSSLDAAGKAELLPRLEALHRTLSLPILYVSHDAGEVARLADRVLTMREGRIAAAAAAPSAACAERALAGLAPAQVQALALAALRAGLRPPEPEEGPG